MSRSTPPFTITNKMLQQISQIMELLGNLENYSPATAMPQLRRSSTIRSIQASLAIEANSLTLPQVQDIIAGKPVTGPANEITEVKNAYQVYTLLDQLDPYSLPDLLRAQGIITQNLTDDSGKFRHCNEGVFRGQQCVFVAPPPDQVPRLMSDLFCWLTQQKNQLHPLIAAAIFHYELLFIHPFSDGNGRTARLWHNLLLAQFRDLFQLLPLETRIQKFQEEYYQVISLSHQNGNSNAFVEFILEMVYELLLEIESDSLSSSPTHPPQTDNFFVDDLLAVLSSGQPLGAEEIMLALNIKSRETLRKNYLDPALQAGLVQMTFPDQPTNKNQRYYLIQNN